MTTSDLIRRYYGAFNEKNHEAMLECLTEDVDHHVNQGEVRRGRAAFAEFLGTMDRHYDERVTELVVLTAEDPSRGAAEFMIDGAYRVRAEGLPPARGQRYLLPVGAFFTVRDDRISRISTYYNLAEWTRQVEGRSTG